MRLSARLRYAVGALGSVLVIVSITALLLGGDGTPVTGYGLVGALMLLIALVGAVPDLMWNEHRGMLWPPLDILERIEIAESTAKKNLMEAKALREEIKAARELILDHLRAQQKSPREGGEDWGYTQTESGDPIDTDEQLLEEMERQMYSLEHEWSVLCYEGEADKEGVQGMLAHARATHDREYRRQLAVKRMKEVLRDESF